MSFKHSLEWHMLVTLLAYACYTHIFHSRQCFNWYE